MNKKDIVVTAWLKDNNEWFYAIKSVSQDLTPFDNIELLSIGPNEDLFYAWNGDNKIHGRLYRGHWNSGTCGRYQYNSVKRTDTL